MIVAIHATASAVVVVLSSIAVLVVIVVAVHVAAVTALSFLVAVGGAAVRQSPRRRVFKGKRRLSIHYYTILVVALSVIPLLLCVGMFVVELYFVVVAACVFVFVCLSLCDELGSELSIVVVVTSLS